MNMGEGPLVDLPLEVEENLWRVTCISVGNPHCVTIVPEVDSLKLEQIGPGLSTTKTSRSASTPSLCRWWTPLT